VACVANQIGQSYLFELWMGSFFCHTRLSSVHHGKPSQIPWISYFAAVNRVQHIVKQVHNLCCQPQESELGLKIFVELKMSHLNPVDTSDDLLRPFGLDR
jgi:hypothetical protein